MSTESRRRANIERAKIRQASAPATNSDVKPGATTTGRAGSAEAAKTQEENSPINLNLYTPKAKAGSTTAGILRYPADPEITEDSDYVVFSFFKYAPPFGGGENTPNQAAANSTTNTQQAKWGYTNYQNSNDRSYNNESYAPIILYMPEDIQSQFGAGWNGAGFGATAAGMMGLAGMVNNQRDFTAMLQGLGGAFPGAVKAATFNALTQGINAVAGANISLNQALGTISGTIINPNVELAYEAPKLRTFSLRFKLVPRSKKEAEQIKKICNRFKKAMLPSFGGQAIFGQAEASNMLTIPDLCQVSFMKGGSLHEYLPKYKLCGITDVNINYTAAGAYATLPDGSPVATELTISFLESKLVFSDEVNEDGSGI